MGRTAGVADLRESFPGRDPEARAEEPPYLSVDGAIDPSRIRFAEAVVPQAPVYEFAGTSGATRMTWTGSVQGGELLAGLRPDPVDRVVEDYLRMWTDSGQPTPDIYAAGAVLRDTLHEVSLTGSQIGDAAAAGRAPVSACGVPACGRSRTARAPPCTRCTTPMWPTSRWTWWCSCSTSPARVPASPTSGPRSGWMTRAGSPGRSATTGSTRCAPAWTRKDLPSGWWQSLAPRAAQVTGTVAVAGNEVTVWNGTPQREALLRWALQRFADAGLPAPAPTSVTFLPAGGRPVDHL